MTLARTPYARLSPADIGQVDRELKKLEQMSAGLYVPKVLVAARSPYTVQGTDTMLLCDCTAGAITLTFPLAARVEGMTVVVVKSDTSTNAVTLSGTFSGGVNPQITVPHAGYTVVAMNGVYHVTAGVTYPVISGETGVINMLYPYYDPRRYGATGDGTTDDSTALLAAIAAAAVVGAGGLSGATVNVAAGKYKFSSQLVVPPGVRIVGAGLQSTELVWTGTSGFGIKIGNNAGVLSYGITLENIAVIVQNTAAHAVLLYGVVDCHLTNVYIEGVAGTTATIGVEIDGANVSAFFIVMTNVHCNHVFKGFVHTTSGTVQPTQVTGINCAAFCNNTAGSIGIDIQTVGAMACGDGVTYLGGDMESCATGVKLDARGSSIHGMRFENAQGVATDILFTPNAKNNAIFGAVNAFTVTDSSGDPTNQWFGVSKSLASGTTQPNKQNDTVFSTPTNTRSTLLSSGANNAGAIGIQNGAIGANDGGAIWLYGGAHATNPNHVAVGIGAGGKFRVNGSGLDNGTDWLTVDRTTGFTTLANASVTGSLRHTGSTLCFYSASPIAKPTVSGSRAGNAALASLLAQLAALGLITDSSTA